MSLLFAAIAVAAAFDAPPPEKAASIMRADDYPVVAMHNGWQGTTHFELTVSPRGRVSMCRVTRTSGHQVLDAQTCRIFTMRAKFEPATNSVGEPIEGTFRTKLDWRLD